MAMLDRDARRIREMCHIHEKRPLPDDICDKWETAWALMSTFASSKSGLPREMLVAILLSTGHKVRLEKTDAGAMSYTFDDKDLSEDPKEVAKREAAEKEVVSG